MTPPCRSPALRFWGPLVALTLSAGSPALLAGVTPAEAAPTVRNEAAPTARNEPARDVAVRTGPLDSDALQDQSRQPILFQADSLTYEPDTSLWSATGNVEVSQSGRLLRADMLTYDEATGTLIATGNVRLSEPDGPMLYAERIEITGELKTGVVQNLRLALDPTSRLAAARAVRRENGVTELERAVYSPCEVCEGDGAPLWQLKASRVIHDEQRKSITYRHARFEIYGVPVLYTPYFSHPDPTVRRKSGFLTPSVGNSTELGNIVEVPYFIVLKPNMDLTVSPMITTREGPVAKAEFRHRIKPGEYSLSGSLANARFFDESEDEFEGRRLRGHLFGEGEFQISPETHAGYQLQLTTDDTYLRRFDISEEDRLTNNIYYRNLRPQGRTVYNGYFFDGLRAEDDDSTTPIVPALVEHRSVFDDPWLGGEVAVDANVLSLFRTGDVDGDLSTNGVDTQRASVSGTWQRPFTSRLGDVMTAVAQVRSDVYYTQDVELDAGNGVVEEDDFLASRVLGLAAVDWRWPFVRGNGSSRQVIEPVVQVIYSPDGGNPDDIPNEDSTSFEFDDTNLFSLNKFPGIDVWEGGSRANVGLRLATYGEEFSAGLLVGQTFRVREQTEFAPGSGLEDEASDYVGRLSVAAGEYLNLTHRFRLDKDSFDFRRNEVDLDLDTKYIDLKAGYLSIDDEQTIGGLEAREEVRLEARARFTENWSARIGGRRDLEEGEMINNFLGLTYEDECTAFEASYRRSFTRDRGIEPSTSVLFRFRLKSVGSN